MPKNMEAAIARHPGQEKAIRNGVGGYQVGGDLRARLILYAGNFHTICFSGAL